MLALAIPTGVGALGAGTVLALVAAAFVLGPLLREDDAPMLPPRTPDRSPKRADVASAVDALREIEFDRETGKLSDDDYGELKAAYTKAALVELRAKDAARESAGGAAVAVSDDEIERTISAFRHSGSGRACVTCGPRPESDAEFCSNCGRYLSAACPNCGAACGKEGQRFCGECGTSLAA